MMFDSVPSSASELSDTKENGAVSEHPLTQETPYNNNNIKKDKLIFKSSRDLVRKFSFRKRSSD
jgi:hypothetical protein